VGAQRRWFEIVDSGWRVWSGHHHAERTKPPCSPAGPPPPTDAAHRLRRIKGGPVKAAAPDGALVGAEQDHDQLLRGCSEK